MSGVTKHIYEHEIIDICKMWNTQLKSIAELLPLNYSKDDVIALLKKYYPHEWDSVQFTYEYYQEKDRYLIKRRGKARYRMCKPEKLLDQSTIFQRIMSNGFKKHHEKEFSDSQRVEAENKLSKKRNPKIGKVNKKIRSSLIKTQQVTPDFIDQLIGLYERKATKQKDKVYILNELKKYYSPRIIKFFWKLNDTELNKQLRWTAFYHLQSFNYQPRARRQKYMQIHTKNKKRKEYLKNVYPNEKFTIPETPQELEYRIQNAKEQQIKTYDYFISHSSKDYESVQKLIVNENRKNKNVFCDWINDVDYLKRELLCEATLRVIELRLEQSKAVLFVSSENSISSIWCKYELNYFHDLKKPIFIIKKEDIENNHFNIKLMKECWYLDPRYKEKIVIKQ